MEKPRFFTHRKSDNSPESSLPIPTGKILKIIGVIVIALVIVSVFGVKLFAFGKQLVNAWPEIWFAYMKPAIVKPIMRNYEKKQAALDQEFQAGGNPDQAFLDAVKQTVDQEMQAKSQTYSFR